MIKPVTVNYYQSCIARPTSNKEESTQVFLSCKLLMEIENPFVTLGIAALYWILPTIMTQQLVHDSALSV